MDKKKVTFAIVLFIILGLFVFAFANPLNDNDVQQVQNASDDKITTSPDDNSGAGLISDNSNNNNNSVNARSTRRNTTRNLDNTTTVIDNTVSLVGDISSAISELKNYRSDYVFTDDTDYKKVISDYTDKINNSNSVEDIVNNLNKGKDEVDILIKKDLDAYKDEAKKAVKEYAESLDIVSDYTELLDNFNKDVDDAESKKEIDKLVEETKNALDELEKKDLADAKTKAIEEIKNYKTEEELDINEITNSKESTINNINNSESINDVNKSLEDGKKEIDDIISNKTFTVTFVTKDNKKFVRTVKYKESAVAPTFKDFDEKVKYKNVYYKFTQWDKEYTNVKSDLTVNAEYRITHMYARLFLLKDGYEIPEDRNKTVSGDAYEYVKTIRIAVSEKNKIIAIADQGAVVRTNTDKIVEDTNKYGELPLQEGKYITYEWYSMKYCYDGFHIDGKLHYDHEQELADNRNEAIDEIKGYKTEDEKYIEEITTIKNDAINDINNTTDFDEMDDIVDQAKKDIDNIIKNKTFTVTFVSFNNNVTKVDVGYKKDAKAPKIDTNPEDSKIYYEFVKWDKDYKNIKSDLTVTAEYKVIKVIAIVFLLKDGLAIPEDPLFTYTVPSAYKRTMEIELKLTDTILNAIKNNKYSAVLASDDDIRSVDKDNKLPKVDKDNKYKTYEFYVMKLCDTTDARFHIDGILHYDKAREELDNKKKELQELINKAKKVDTTNKTEESKNKLKEDIRIAEESINADDIDKISASIESLKNINLIDIKVTKVYVTNNKESYYDNEDFDLTVKYDNNNGVSKEQTDKFKVTNKDNTPGTHTATVTFEGVSATFEYTVLATEITSIKVVNNKYEYFKNENADITVTASYNNGTSKVLKTNEYTSTFDSTITTYTGKKGANVPRIAEVVANGKKDTFEYSISTFTKDEYNRYLINQIDVSVHHPWRSDEYYIRFDDKDDKVKIVSVSQDNTTFVTLIPTDDKHRYDLSEDDYDVINYNNTLFAGEYIEIIYEAHGIKYKAKYSELLGELYLKSLTQI